MAHYTTDFHDAFMSMPKRVLSRQKMHPGFFFGGGGCFCDIYRHGMGQHLGCTSCNATIGYGHVISPYFAFLWFSECILSYNALKKRSYKDVNLSHTCLCYQ